MGRTFPLISLPHTGVRCPLYASISKGPLIGKSDLKENLVMAIEAPTQTWVPKDYKSELKPIWCAGCGDFGVLNALYKAMAMCSLDPENTVVVSGIGCSSRLPGFVASYGFHGVHGRALPIATGIKAARPDLNVIVVG